MASGATPAVAEEVKFYALKDNGIPFVRVQNLGETAELYTDDLKYINQFTHTVYLKRSQVKPGNLLTKITGVGRMAVSAVAPDGFTGNINQHIVVSKTADAETSAVLAAYLNSDIGEKLASRRATGGTRPALDYPALRSIPVVFNPEIVTLLKNGADQKRQKEDEAQAILDSIDIYLLDALGVVLPTELPNTIQNRTFQTSWQQVTGGRLDPVYQQTYYHDLLSALSNVYPMRPLREVSSTICIGKTPAKDKYTESGKPLIKAGCLKRGYVDWNRLAYTNNEQLSITVMDGDILMLSAAHQISYIGKNPCIVEIPQSLISTCVHFVGEVLCIRPNKNKIDPYYLLALLNSQPYYKLVNRQTRGQTSHLYPNDMYALTIPVPDESLQRQIGAEFRSRFAMSKDLNLQAQQGFAKAKQAIEQLILNG